MALTGTLDDMALIDLVQFPHAGGKTGQLSIEAGDLEARLYYDRGKLVHVEVDNLSGMEALIDIIAWKEGRFTYEADVQPAEQTIDFDLHHAVMEALRIHDERKHEEERLQAGIEEEETERDEALQPRIADYVRANDFAQYACVMSSEGRLKAEAHSGEEMPEIAGPLRKALYGLFTAYPREDLEQVIILDNQNTVVMAPLSAGETLAVVADRSAPRGSVAMSVDRFANELK